VVAVDASGTVLASARLEYLLRMSAESLAVEDLEDIFGAVQAAIAEVADQVRVTGLAFSTAVHSLMALDASGKPLTPLLTWADERASEQAKRLRGSEQGRALHRRTGTPIHPMSPLAKLLWFWEHEPG
jgi:gluconokinase